jgi:hypothetical protein
VEGLGWHSFKRFRNSWLRAPAQRCQEDLRKFWLAHKPKEMGEVYSALKEDEGRVAQLGEHLLCKHEPSFQAFHPLLCAFNVFNNFGESASRSK